MASPGAVSLGRPPARSTPLLSAPAPGGLPPNKRMERAGTTGCGECGRSFAIR